MARPRAKHAGSSAGVGEAEEAQFRLLGFLDRRKPRHCGGLCRAQAQCQQLAFFGGEAGERVPRGRLRGGGRLHLWLSHHLFEQSLERFYTQMVRITQGGDTRGTRQLLVVAAIRQQPVERVIPGADVLRGNVGDGNHLVVHALLVFLDGPHGQQIIDAQLGFGNAAHVAGNHRHAMQHGFDDDARPRLGPQRRNQQHARADQQLVDGIDRRQNRDVGLLFQRAAVVHVGAPQRNGGETHVRHTLGQRQKNGNALHRARIHERDEFVLEARQRLVGSRIEERDRHVHGLDAALAADVVRDILADAHNRAGAAQHVRFRGARKRAVRAERKSQAWRARDRRRGPFRRATRVRAAPGRDRRSRRGLCPA